MERPESSIDPMKHFAYAREHRKVARRKLFFWSTVVVLGALLVIYQLYVGVHNQPQLQLPQHPVSALFPEKGDGARFLLFIYYIDFYI